MVYYLFTSETCPACYEVKKSFEDFIKDGTIIEIDINKPENKELVEKFKIMSVPVAFKVENGAAIPCEIKYDEKEQTYVILPLDNDNTEEHKKNNSTQEVVQQQESIKQPDQPIVAIKRIKKWLKFILMRQNPEYYEIIKSLPETEDTHLEIEVIQPKN